uniref:Secreted protein n=1 Tax=Panagrellus redivivus TaxID=6233 RepID=A0A7E4W5H4_PANRE
MMKAFCLVVLSFGAVLATDATNETVEAVAYAPQFTTAPQCKCSDIDQCTADILDKVNKCKVAPQCEKFLTKIGDPTKIRACLDKEHAEMQKLEDCVKAKVGALGCSNDANPGNLTIPLIPVVEVAEAFEGDENMPEVPMAAPPMENPVGPPEMTQFLMCVDQCSMAEVLEAESHSRKKRNAVNCAFKLRCALAPPDAKIQTAFEQCEKDLGIEPVKKLKDSCQCLKDAGIQMECPQ